MTMAFPALWQREYTGKMDGGCGEACEPSSSPREAEEKILPRKSSQAQHLFRSKPSS